MRRTQEVEWIMHNNQEHPKMPRRVNIQALVGRNVRRLRRAAELSQGDFAKRSGLSQQYVSSLEMGEANPTVKTLLDIAATLSVPPAALITYDR